MRLPSKPDSVLCDSERLPSISVQLKWNVMWPRNLYRKEIAGTGSGGFARSGIAPQIVSINWRREVSNDCPDLDEESLTELPNATAIGRGNQTGVCFQCLADDPISSDGFEMRRLFTAPFQLLVRDTNSDRSVRNVDQNRVSVPNQRNVAACGRFGRNVSDRKPRGTS